MEVLESEWVAKAIGNVDKYLNRGGPLQGDVPQKLGGVELVNNIGFAMGLPLVDPSNWTARELEFAKTGNLPFFQGDALKAIQVIVDRITELCSGDTTNYITILPVELYSNGKLYELPLFRVSRYEKSQRYFVDNIGRSYTSFSDWYNNNRLPPGIMLYPGDGVLKQREGFQYSNCHKDDTPSNRTSTKVARGVDIGASVVGIASAVGATVLSGGWALPFIIAGVGTAGYGTIRSTVNLVDRGTHGESINPFTNSESRMLWLGIAANLVSFGAMGATMRLGSLVANGKNISEAFRLVVNIANGVNLGVSGVATLNSVIYMICNWDDMSKADVLIQCVSIAFWTKGAITYKTAGTLIKDYQAAAYKSLSSMLPEGNEIVPTDNVEHNRLFLRGYYEATQRGMEPMTAFRFVVNSMGGLSSEQLDSFKDLRAFVNNDAKFFDAIFRFTSESNMSPQQATKVIIQAWDTLNQMPTNTRPTLQLINQGIVVGHGHVLTIQQLNELPPTTLNFVYQQLAPLNVDQSATWQLIKVSVGSASINENQLLIWAASQTTRAGRLPAVLSNLLWLQSFGLFTQCPVTLLLPGGNTVVEMNRHLRVSLVYLRSVDDVEKMRNLIQGVGNLPADPSSQPNWNQSNIRKLVVQQLRLRFEFQRRESVNQILRQLPRDVHNRLDVLEPHEKDRLYTIAADMTQLANVGSNVITKAFGFAVVMQFRNASELAAYFQFAVVEFHNEVKLIRDENRKNNIQEGGSSRSE